MVDGQEVTLGGTRFRVEVVNPTYTKLHPVDDPVWHLKFLEQIAPRENPDESAT